MQVTTKGEALSFDVETGEFVQILNIPGVYWITTFQQVGASLVKSMFLTACHLQIYKKERKNKSLLLSVHLNISLF